MTKRPLVPPFLNKLDDYLLIHRPTTWTARTHLVFWYSLLFAAALTLICFIVPNDPREYTVVHYWVIFVSVVLFVGIIGWLIYLLRFNVFKRYGHLPAAYGTKTFFLYAAAIGSMIACAYIPPVVESVRANMSYSNEEIVNDGNIINLDLCKLERDSLLTKWSSETGIVRDDPSESDATDYYSDRTKTDYERRQLNRAEDDTDAESGNSSFHYIYKKRLNDRLKYEDSVIRVNDSTYVFYTCPAYDFVGASYEDDYSRVKALSSPAIYDRIIRHYTVPDGAAVKKELDSIIEKYRTQTGPDWNYYSFPDDYQFRRKDYYDHIRNKYGINEVSSSMSNIKSRKYRWKGHTIQESLRLFYYLVLIFTIFVVVFRHSTIKTFFLSLLTMVVLSILTAFFFAFGRIDSDRAVDLVLLFYFWLFVVLSLTIRLDRVRTAWKGISLNLFVLGVPYIPLLCVNLYYEYKRLGYSSYKDSRVFAHEKLHYLLSEIAGFVILVVLLDTVILPLYRRWYALPEQ
ncbi:MAG TPA: hypothetical protein VGM41_01155 [Chitinophagaceae bacterium]